ncbi:MAG TPA: M20/M25/M40 family metallo-hydrolase, partial [Candidatus Krumholzibacterium sp.]|nr:M20/M25/M40 family metallo-hydrolase [Candidatus Krumholzibacterium sp.]
MAFLRTPDEALANKYLETTGQYIEMYRKIIGEYPFSKFALVENFWETGYGMPSFTLLGEKVIRFPFILHSSYPHELLHNYWGNSVYIDFETGNWCEGLTAYMADHLIKEQRGQGDEYRRDALRRYTDYVREGNDFPLSGFISRHDAASEAVGYGKSMMMWHMLRMQLGDEAFIEGVRAFYADNIFKAASFDDLRRAFERTGGKGLVSFFRQWVERTGAPELRLVEVKAGPATIDRASDDGAGGGSSGTGGGYVMDITIEQVQEAEPYTLELPVAVSFADSIVVRDLVMFGRYERFSLKFRDLPVHVQLDPEFDIFRRLDPAEIPPSLSGAFGAERITVVLPSAGGSAGGARREDELALLEAYRDIAEGWAGDESVDVEIVMDDEIGALPKDRVVWVMGRTNRLRKYLDEGLEGRKALISGDGVQLGNSRLEWTDNSIVLAVRHPGDPSSVMAWLALGSPEAAPGLARKIPHYGKYGYLAFTGDEPDNIVKGQWEAIASPMASFVDSDRMYGEVSYAGLDLLPRREPLAKLAPLFSQERMMKDIKYLSSDGLEGRGPGSVGIEKAADYIAERFAEAGLSPGGDDGTFFQRWQDTAGADGRTVTMTNVIGVLPGSDMTAGAEGSPGASGEGPGSPSVVLCAHYDHLGRGWPDVHPGYEGKIHPGADDNASGVSVMIELARHLARNVKPSRSIVFAAFTAEESGLRGSRHFIETMKGPGGGPGSQAFPLSSCIGAVNLDTVGRLGARKVLILGASSAREWRFIFIGGSYVTGVESEVVTQDIDASDNASFVEAGVPAVQLFAGPHEDYHRPSDTSDRIDPEGLVKIASLAREALLYLAERKEPLDFSGTVNAAAGHPGGTRPDAGGFATKRVGTGCMPDFAFSGNGVRVGSVSKDSPASEAGIEPGDVIVRIGEYDVTGLKEYSAALKNFRPGDETTIVVVRGGEELRKTIVLKER